MAQHLRVADHESPRELKVRFLASTDPVERTHWQVLHLASLSWRSEDIAATRSSGSVSWCAVTARPAPRRWRMPCRTCPHSSFLRWGASSAPPHRETVPLMVREGVEEVGGIAQGCATHGSTPAA
jgi:hypothetical protein